MGSLLVLEEGGTEGGAPWARVWMCNSRQLRDTGGHSLQVEQAEEL